MYTKKNTISIIIHIITSNSRYFFEIMDREDVGRKKHKTKRRGRSDVGREDVGRKNMVPHDVCIHENNKGEARGRSRHQNNSKNSGRKERENEEDITMTLTGDRDSLYH